MLVYSSLNFGDVEGTQDFLGLGRVIFGDLGNKG